MSVLQRETRILYSFSAVKPNADIPADFRADLIEALTKLMTEGLETQQGSILHLRFIHAQ